MVIKRSPGEGKKKKKNLNKKKGKAKKAVRKHLHVEDSDEEDDGPTPPPPTGPSKSVGQTTSRVSYTQQQFLGAFGSIQQSIQQQSMAFQVGVKVTPPIQNSSISLLGEINRN